MPPVNNFPSLPTWAKISSASLTTICQRCQDLPCANNCFSINNWSPYLPTISLFQLICQPCQQSAIAALLCNQQLISLYVKIWSAMCHQKMCQVPTTANCFAKNWSVPTAKKWCWFKHSQYRHLFYDRLALNNKYSMFLIWFIAACPSSCIQYTL